jgi:hypothetical protein
MVARANGTGFAVKFVVIFGPPAAGKMTVGRELAALTGWRLFHNHRTYASRGTIGCQPVGAPKLSVAGKRASSPRRQAGGLSYSRLRKS